MKRLFLVVWLFALFSALPSLPASATAEQVLVDMYAGDTGGTGSVKSTIMKLFGPDAHRYFGDPYTPLDSLLYSELNGRYTYRIAVPSFYDYNKVRVELFDPDTGNRTDHTGTWYNFSTTSGTGGAYNCTSDSDIQRQCGSNAAVCPCEPCAKPTGLADDPFWFHRVDDIRSSAQTYGSYASSWHDYNVETIYRLYYYQEQPAGSLQEVDLAYYVGKRGMDDNAAKAAEALATDLTWVSPGAPAGERMPAFTAAQLGFTSGGFTAAAEPATTVEACGTAPFNMAGSCAGDGNFIVDLNSETPGIYRDPNSGLRHIYLQVIGRDTSGTDSSGNAYDLWAGPALSEDDFVVAPANINARQFFIERNRVPSAPGTGTVFHSSRSLAVYGMGHLPMYELVNSRNELALTYLGPEYAGLTMSVDFYDLDVMPVAPVVFYFGNPSTQADWNACFGTSSQCSAYPNVLRYPMPAGFGTSDAWARFSFTIPSEGANPPFSGLPFYGGRLYVSYQSGMGDTFHIKIIVAPRPAPELLAPANGSTITDSIPTFDWGDVIGATRYQIQVDDSAGFSSPEVDVISAASTYTPDTPLVNGTYYWRVRTEGAGGWSAYGETWTVTIDAAATITVNETVDELNTDGDCSLREAIRAANTNVVVDACPAGSNTNTDTVVLASGATYALTIGGADEDAGLTGDLDIINNMAATDLILNVAGGGTATIDASGIVDRVIHILGQATVEISNVTIQAGHVSSGDASGGGIKNGSGMLTVINSIFSFNRAALFGGGISNRSGTLVITDSTFANNSSALGGGIGNDVSGTLTVTSSTFSGNTTGTGGGGIENSGIATVTSSVFANNSSGAVGGGIRNVGTLAVINSVFSSNWASADSFSYADALGGGIANVGMLTVTGSTFTGNSASVPDAPFDSMSSGYGGGIYNIGTLAVTSSTLSANSANDYGGGVYNADMLTVANSTVSGNEAMEGGGIYNHNAGTLTVTNGTLSSNEAVYGGGIWNSSGTVYLAGTILDTGASGANCYQSVTDNGYNLSGDASCGFSGVGSQNNATLNLGELANNGGLTRTHLPGAGSAAIDLIPDGTVISNNGISYTCNQTGEPLDVDQRGQQRPATLAGRCDAGAVEAGDLPAIPSLASPTGGSTITDNTPTFDWSDVVGATEYQVEVDDSADFSSPVISTTATASTYTPTEALVNGTYYWHVKAGNGVWSAYSGAWTVTVIAPLPAPALVSPADGSTTADLTPAFDWDNVAGASRYQLLVDDTANFSSPVLNIQVTASTYTASTALANGTYYWRVRTRNTLNTWGAYGAAWTVTLNGVLPDAPTLLTPADGSTTADLTPVFDWADVAGASRYQLLVDDAADFSSPVLNVQPTTSTYTASTALAAGTYYWRVRTRDSMNTWGAYGTAWTVTLNGVLPAAPTLLTPTDGSSTTDTTPTFDWIDVAGASRYQLQVDDSASFSSPAVSVNRTVSNYTGSTALPLGTYYWRVRTQDTLGTWGNWSAPWTLSIIPVSVDMTITESVSPTAVDVGTSPVITYSVSITNNSATVTATNVVVTNPLSADLQSITATPSIGSCFVVSNTVTCAMGTLAPAASASVTISAVVQPGVVAGTVISSQATVTANELIGSKVSEPPATVLVRGADIGVTKAVDATIVSEGQPFTYTITAHNYGPSDAENITISDVLPSTLQYVSHSADAGTAYDPVSGLWSVGSVSSLASKRLTITVSAVAGTAGSIIINSAALQSSTPPQPAGGGQPDAASVSVYVVASSADLALTQTVNPSGTMNPGAALTYTLTVVNNGPGSVAGRSVQDTALRDAFSSGLLQFVSATTSWGSFDAGTGQWTGIDLNAGQTATAAITVTAAGTPDTDVVFNNAANIVPGTPADPNMANNTATTTIQISWPDPIFINSGNPAGGCVETTWGAEDPTLGKDYTWGVVPTNWERLGGGQDWNLVNYDWNGAPGSHFIRNDETTVAPLSASGQNLLGCRTSTGLSVGNTFTYHFFNLLPGRWRVVLAFAPTTADKVGYRLLQADTSKDNTAWQTLPGMDVFDMVDAIQAAGFNPFEHYVDPAGPNNEYYNIHYIIKTFDNVTVDTGSQLWIRVTRVGGSPNFGAQVNGLGIEYLGP